MADKHFTRDTPATPEPAKPEPNEPASEPTSQAVPAEPEAPESSDDKKQPNPSADMNERIVVVAQMRAEGGTWNQVALRFGYSTGECARKVISAYRLEWDAAMGYAREELRPQYEAEAVLTLRELMRPIKPIYGRDGRATEDASGQPVYEERKEQVRESSAHALLQHVSRMGAQEINLRMRGHLGTHTTRLDELDDVELDEILASAVAARQARESAGEE